MLQHAVAVIENARLEIAKHINGNIASAYWEIGKMLHERKVESGHGDGVVRQLSVDLKERYPKMGLSPRNLWYMKRFYLRYCGSDVKVQRSVALLPWSHNVYLLGKNLDDSATLYYAQETIDIGKQRDTYHRDISPSESTTCPYKQEQNEQGERRANHQRAEILHLYLRPVVCQ